MLHRQNFSRQNMDQMVGVVDLCDGKAVHAVQGIRHQYQSVGFCDGDPLKLIDHYLQSGLWHFYFADLDAISGKSASAEVIQELCERCREYDVLIDLGLNGNDSDQKKDLILNLADLAPHSLWVGATETMEDHHSLTGLAEMVGASRTALSLDYRCGKLLGCYDDESAWITACQKASIHRVVILDLAAVGTGAGPVTSPQCQRVRELNPDVILYSGGGLSRPSHLCELADSGCQFFLMASALYP